MIGYYVHHVGDGHLTRAGAIANELGRAVTGLSSRPAPGSWNGDWIELPRDDDVALPARATAGGALHWAPVHHAGLRDRMAEIAAWVRRARPQLLVVDVSVEVAVFARLLGVPVVVMAMPGNREDPAHQLAYRVSDAILAAWPAWAEPMEGAAPWRDKLHPTGAISRFDTRPAPALPAAGGGRVLVLSGTGGTVLTEDHVDAAERATPGWRWDVLGPPRDRWELDPWEALGRADVVVCHAGQSVVAEVAAARRPAVVVPQDRPHGEQRATADVLASAGLAVVRPQWPAAAQWPAILAEAVRTGGEGWARWSAGGGAGRAAAVLEALCGVGVPEAACGPR